MDFRYLFLPYCLLKQENGSYLVLNRNYKPLSFNTNDHLDYKAYPIETKFKNLTKNKAALLSWNKSTNLDKIFLYNDACIPIVSANHMNEYLKKLRILSKLQVEKGKFNEVHIINKDTEFEYSFEDSEPEIKRDILKYDINEDLELILIEKIKNGEIRKEIYYSGDELLVILGFKKNNISNVERIKLGKTLRKYNYYKNLKLKKWKIS